ncbi:MAG TPA: hypothetical protein VH394_27895 [Thermoanaerobaculia bacterium]|jgi:hypothetical protein|nr:hypothetical protein [Thermoanaerobaculia bacterium]
MISARRLGPGFLLALTLAVSGCRGEKPPMLEFVQFPPQVNEEASNIQVPPAESLVAILARPEDFDGKRLSVQGVINLELEGDQLCLDRGSLQYLATKNCLYVRLSKKLSASYREIAAWNGHYAWLEGEIVASDHGHMGLFRAAIAKVDRIVIIKPPGRELPE